MKFTPLEFPPYINEIITLGSMTSTLEGIENIPAIEDTPDIFKDNQSKWRQVTTDIFVNETSAKDYGITCKNGINEEIAYSLLHAAYFYSNILEKDLAQLAYMFASWFDCLPDDKS